MTALSQLWTLAPEAAKQCFSIGSQARGNASGEKGGTIWGFSRGGRGHKGLPLCLEDIVWKESDAISARSRDCLPCSKGLPFVGRAPLARPAKLPFAQGAANDPAEPHCRQLATMRVGPILV